MVVTTWPLFWSLGRCAGPHSLAYVRVGMSGLDMSR